ncbi:MAG: hypothetical protein HY326_09180 [Chloroflexi bacterium]|nr:hypothetical protein [Chloroflexota bacterium]
MVVIRMDRRVFYAILIGVVVVIVLLAGFFLGRSAGSTGSAAVPQNPQVQIQQQPQIAAPAQGNTSGAAQAPQQQLQVQPQQQAPADNAVRISIEDAAKKLGQPNVLFIDARTAQEYQKGHIKGAISIPEGEAQNRLNQIPRDKDLIIYCA